MSTTTEDPEREPKKYCCGNSAQNEAGYVSKCDIGIAVYGILGYSVVSILTFVSPATLENYVKRNPTLKDFTKYLEADIPYKIIFLVSSILWLLFELSLAILLLRGSSQREKSLLKNWFNITVTVCLIGIATALFSCYYFEQKVYIGVIALCYYLYKSYGLWICTELLDEMKAGSNPYTIPFPSDF